MIKSKNLDRSLSLNILSLIAYKNTIGRFTCFELLMRVLSSLSRMKISEFSKRSRSSIMIILKSVLSKNIKSHLNVYLILILFYHYLMLFRYLEILT